MNYDEMYYHGLSGDIDNNVKLQVEKYECPECGEDITIEIDNCPKFKTNLDCKNNNYFSNNF